MKRNRNSNRQIGIGFTYIKFHIKGPFKKSLNSSDHSPFDESWKEIVPGPEKNSIILQRVLLLLKTFQHVQDSRTVLILNICCQN